MFLTDPDRTPEPWHRASRLPPGAGVVFRWFGRPDSLQTGRRLAEACREVGLTFLVGADEALAEALDADGLHLPERALGEAPAIRRRRPGWLITGAAHSREALEAASVAGLDAALLSPVFDSGSPSAGAALGPQTFRALAQAARLPVYALGGIDANTAPTLAGSAACGLAVVSAL
jgi:thiamine-phosphate pyrophosphorylase